MAQSRAAAPDRPGHAAEPLEGGSVLSADRPGRLSAIIPARNKARFIERCVGSVLEAALRSNAEVIIVENGSTDQTWAALEQQAAGKAILLRSDARTAGAARNLGARSSAAEVFCFLDADVEVPADYFERVRSVLAEPAPAAAGCTVELADDGWISRTWGRLHDRGIDHQATFINAANFCVRRDAFVEVGGFDDTLVTGEDADICLRLVEAGHDLVETNQLRVLHLDNPRTLREFARKEIWHGLGAWATVRRDRPDRPFLMTLAHGLLLATGMIVLVGRGFDPAGWSLGLAAGFAVPLTAVSYRRSLAKVRAPLLPSVTLYQVYFLARLAALVLAIGGRHRSA